jgi:GTP-binding protein Era
VGRPNSGKSTLLNRLLGTRISIVSEHPQTTRTHLLGIWNAPATDSHPAGQIVFVDTPGVHKANSLFNREMMRHVREALEDRALTLLLFDVTRKFGEEDRYALQLIARAGGTQLRIPTILALNKIDVLKDKQKLLPIIEDYRMQAELAEVIPISALTGENVQLLVESLFKHLPEGPQYFPDDQVTDAPERFLAAEVIREKALRVTREEVPHTLAVKIEQWEETPRLQRISAALYCERAGQKAILIGHGGERIKQIGTQARQELERMLDRKVFLELHVIVREQWRRDPRFISSLDWRRDLPESEVEDASRSSEEE